MSSWSNRFVSVGALAMLAACHSAPPRESRAPAPVEAAAPAAATFESAELYRQLGKDLMSSERPRNLNKDELEQYDVLLEEQAFPFEEKAIKLHEVNAARTKDGTYDEWVQKSFAALAQLNPGRYGKVEIGEQLVESIR